LRPYLKSIALAVAALIICAALGCRGSAENAFAPPEAPVVILNGAGRAVVCEGISVKLGGEPGAVAGFRNGDGELDYSVRETLIRCDGRYSTQAEAVRGRLGFGVVSLQPGLKNVEVVVGWDAPQPSFDSPPTDGVYIDKSEKAIYYFRKGELSRIWPCAIGKEETPTPTGRYEVTVALEKPTWYWRGEAIPPGPENGLGDWFIGINKRGYGLHGTNEPPSIGTAASHGCVRMYNDDAGELVKMVSPGTPVVIAE
jgi:hypothetical protein